MKRSRLHELSEHGVSVWIDSLSREMLETGALARLMDEDAVVGVTSNPTIFQKALAEGDWYDEQLRAAATEIDDPVELFFALAQEDIRDACDLLAPVWERTGGVDGYVSLEVDPTLAYDRDASFEQAMRFHREVDRQEPLRQDPGDGAGPRRDRGLHRRGALDQRHADLLARALRRGRRGVPARARAARRGGRRSGLGHLGRELLRLARRHRGRPPARGGRPHRPAGDARDRQREARLRALEGRRSRAIAGRRSRRRAPGTQRCLWASTSTKNPAYRDVLYVEELIGPGHGEHDAARDDPGVPGPRRGARHARDRRSTRRARSCAELADAGVDYDDVVETLEREGVEKFADSFSELLDGITTKLEAVTAK